MTPPTVQFIPATGETVYDTYTQSTMNYTGSGTGYYFTTSPNGSWTSTGTTVGDYAEVTDQTTPIQTSFGPPVFRLGEISGQSWDTTKKIRVSLNGGTAVTATFTGTGNGGRYEFAPDITLAETDTEPGGTLGWSNSNLLIEVIDS
jgi:hypothetical protein